MIDVKVAAIYDLVKSMDKKLNKLLKKRKKKLKPTLMDK